MVAHVVVEGENAFWEVHCPRCRALVFESLHYAEADCEECGELVEVQLGGGSG